MKSGAVASVIESLSKTVSDAGKTPKLYQDNEKLAQECAKNGKGVSKCYGAVLFLSSPEEGSSASQKGTWNYTVKAPPTVFSGGSVNVGSDMNGYDCLGSTAHETHTEFTR
jgi:ATP-binding cassette subfamily A (ABC1) protein 3